MRNETDIRTRWDQHDNETRLEERAEMIDKWRCTLEKTLADVNAEIDSLKEAKLDAERALEAKNLPLAVTTDCLTIRDGRQNIDNVDDEVENQFKKVSFSASVFPLQSLISNFVNFCSCFLDSLFYSVNILK